MCTLHGTEVETKAPKEGIIAYRVMRVKHHITAKPGLFSVYTHYRSPYEFQTVGAEYKLGVKYKAKNYTTSNAMYLGESYPTKNNEMGFYAFKTYQQALKARKLVGLAKGCMSVARVRLFGRMVWYEDGYRAEYMKVEAIVCGRRPEDV